MGKRIIQQRRGRGGFSYRVKNSAFRFLAGYPAKLEGTYKVIKLIPSAGHTTPLAMIMNNKGERFYTFAANMLYVGQEVVIGGSSNGDISKLGDLKNGTKVFNIENTPRDGGKLIRSGGSYGLIMNKENGVVRIFMPSKQEKDFPEESRATVGVVAADGRKLKPVLKAGKQFHIKLAKSKLWPRTSALKMNKIDHPFGSGRGKRIKSKIAKRNAPPGKKVGLLRPRRTGRKKR